MERLPPCPLERRRRAAQRMGLPEGAAACQPRTGCRAELTQGHPWGRCGRRVAAASRLKSCSVASLAPPAQQQLPQLSPPRENKQPAKKLLKIELRNG